MLEAPLQEGSRMGSISLGNNDKRSISPKRGKLCSRSSSRKYRNASGKMGTYLQVMMSRPSRWVGEVLRVRMGANQRGRQGLLMELEEVLKVYRVQVRICRRMLRLGIRLNRLHHPRHLREA